MKRLIICLVALALTACEFEFSINKQKIQIYELSVECVDEEVTTTDTVHTYLCEGVVGGYDGEFNIRVLNGEFIYLYLLLIDTKLKFTRSKCQCHKANY